jgi:hypothetical protein
VKQHQQSRRAALGAAQRFLTDHADVLGAVPQSKAKGQLDEVLQQLDLHGAEQQRAQAEVTSRTQEKSGLREALRLHHMQPIATIARAKLAATPAITDLRLPTANADDSTLVDAARAMADAAGPYQPVFEAEMLPNTFLDDLRAAATAVKQAVGNRGASRGRLRAATKGVEDQLTRGYNVLRILNALVVKQLAGQSDLLAAWQQAKHPRAKSGVPRGTVRTPSVDTSPSVTAPVAQAAVVTAVAVAPQEVPKAA